ncbi:MAG TPA: hypothetical protein VF020_05845, partial [Chthoniobacterales bacterium]
MSLGQAQGVRRASWRIGVSAKGRNATKWHDRTAQGFSPGYGHHRGCALQGRPNEVRLGPIALEDH